MPQSDATISKALAEAKGRLGFLQLEVSRYEKIVDNLEAARQLEEKGDVRPKRMKYGPRVKKELVAAQVGDAAGSWGEAIRQALSGGVLHTKKSLAIAALAIRKSGSKGAAYQAVLYGLRNKTISESASGVVSLAG